jgi:hypothetical protein
MKWVPFVSYQFGINVNLTNVVIPCRGLRYGVPNFSYLFILCAEGFSAPHQTRAMARFKGLSQMRNVNHLMFINDSLLLFEANEGSVLAVNSIISAYEWDLLSWEVINCWKTSVMYSASTWRSVNNMLHIIDLESEASRGKHLELATYIGRSNKKCNVYLRMHLE